MMTIDVLNKAVLYEKSTGLFVMDLKQIKYLFSYCTDNNWSQ